MTIAEMIYQHSLRLPEAQALEVLNFIEFIEQRQRQPPSIQSEVERQQALAYLDSLRIDWNGKPIPDRNALYDDVRC